MGIISKIFKNKTENPKQKTEQPVEYAVDDFKLSLIKTSNFRKITKEQIMRLYDKGFFEGVSKEQVLSHFDDKEAQPILYDTLLGNFHIHPKRQGYKDYYPKDEVVQEVNRAVLNTILDFGNNLQLCSKNLIKKYVQRQLKYCTIKDIENLSYHKEFSTQKNGKISQLSLLVGKNHILPDINPLYESTNDNENNSGNQPEN